jgi:hypothetical protein
LLKVALIYTGKISFHLIRDDTQSYLSIREIGCWPWDVCAGIVIAEEAGGVVTGSHNVFASTEKSSFGEVTEEILTGRKYIVVRGIADTPVSYFLVCEYSTHIDWLS